MIGKKNDSIAFLFSFLDIPCATEVSVDERSNSIAFLSIGLRQAT